MPGSNSLKILFYGAPVCPTNEDTNYANYHGLFTCAENPFALSLANKKVQ